MGGLSKRAVLVLANKMDLPESQENFEEFMREIPPGLEVFPLSAASDQDFSEVKNKIRELAEAAKQRDQEACYRRNI